MTTQQEEAERIVVALFDKCYPHPTHENIEETLLSFGQSEFERGVRESAGIAAHEELPEAGKMPITMNGFSKEEIAIAAVQSTIKHIVESILTLLPSPEGFERGVRETKDKMNNLIKVLQENKQHCIDGCPCAMTYAIDDAFALYCSPEGKP